MTGSGKRTVRRVMQNVSFHDVDAFLEYLPHDERIITERLRNLIFDSIPGITEKLSYNVPFYKKHRNICFIWPASVPWGGMKQSGVRLGFTKGYLLRDETGYLDKGDRKQVYWRDFLKLSEIDPDLIRMFLFEAADLDAAAGRPKK